MGSSYLVEVRPVWHSFFFVNTNFVLYGGFWLILDRYALMQSDTSIFTQVMRYWGMGLGAHLPPRPKDGKTWSDSIGRAVPQRIQCGTQGAEPESRARNCRETPRQCLTDIQECEMEWPSQDDHGPRTPESLTRMGERLAEPFRVSGEDPAGMGRASCWL